MMACLVPSLMDEDLALGQGPTRAKILDTAPDSLSISSEIIYRQVLQFASKLRDLNPESINFVSSDGCTCSHPASAARRWRWRDYLTGAHEAIVDVRKRAP
mmetsp:Transcript_24950/g.63538  ORF Transcript_24950/g.63538 Transcript_24950/m.63538 type:complete len:101 (-) Transcript_24950:1-303(-)